MPVKIKDWTKTAAGYEATGANSETVKLTFSWPKEWASGTWILTVRPVGGPARSLELGKRATFDHAEAALLKWGEKS